ncbi:hypothetical protein K7432_016046 [Basidiobolus ranarum]|uniref:AAA+ ATPase domain-containing protein n=1 Tax=Basidiobolus ranarum TaxID=34480 RepID=A0ABR2VM68_9FUNG
MSKLAYYEKLAENGTSLTPEVFNWMMGLYEDDVIAKTYVALSIPAANAYGQGQYDRRQEEKARRQEEAQLLRLQLQITEADEAKWAPPNLNQLLTGVNYNNLELGTDWESLKFQAEETLINSTVFATTFPFVNRESALRRLVGYIAEMHSLLEYTGNSNSITSQYYSNVMKVARLLTITGAPGIGKTTFCHRALATIVNYQKLTNTPSSTSGSMELMTSTASDSSIPTSPIASTSIAVSSPSPSKADGSSKIIQPVSDEDSSLFKSFRSLPDSLRDALQYGHRKGLSLYVDMSDLVSILPSGNIAIPLLHAFLKSRKASPTLLHNICEGAKTNLRNLTTTMVFKHIRQTMGIKRKAVLLLFVDETNSILSSDVGTQFLSNMMLAYRQSMVEERETLIFMPIFVGTRQEKLLSTVRLSGAQKYVIPIPLLQYTHLCEICRLLITKALPDIHELEIHKQVKNRLLLAGGHIRIFVELLFRLGKTKISGDFSWRQLYSSLIGKTPISLIDRAVDDVAKDFYDGTHTDVLKIMPRLAAYQVLQKPVFLDTVVEIPGDMDGSRRPGVRISALVENGFIALDLHADKYFVDVPFLIFKAALEKHTISRPYVLASVLTHLSSDENERNDMDIILLKLEMLQLLDCTSFQLGDIFPPESFTHIKEMQRIEQKYCIPQNFIRNRLETGFDLDSLRELVKQNLNCRLKEEVTVAFINYPKASGPDSVLFVEPLNSPSDIAAVPPVAPKKKVPIFSALQALR